VGRRRGPNLFERTSGKGRGCQRNEGDFGSSDRDASAGGDATGMTGFRSSRSRCSEATFVANRNREEVTHRGGWLPGTEERWLSQQEPGPTQRRRRRSRARSTLSEDARRARREQAVRMDDRSSGHDLRSGSRCPEDLESRSHLDSPGARVDRSLASVGRLARVTEGQRGERPCSGDESRKSRARSGLERGRVRTKARPSCRDARLHPTSTRGSGRERGTNRVHVFENRKKVGCKRPRPTRLVMHRGEGSESRRRRLSGLPRRGTESEGLADRTSNRGAVGSGSSPVMDRHSHEWPRGWSNRTRRDCIWWQRREPRREARHIVTVSIFPPCLR